MSTVSRTAIANGTNEVERKAASDANAVQDGVNIVAIVGAFHRHLLAMKDVGVFGDALNNHPVALAFTSKLIALCRLTDEREMAALVRLIALNTGRRLSTKWFRSDLHRL